jgi:hypothetical protein
MPEIQLLAQVHDAVYFQYPEGLDETKVITKALSLVEIALAEKGRQFVVPGEAKIGWNWASADPKCKLFSDGNPEGLVKWSAQAPDKRVRTPDMERRL